MFFWPTISVHTQTPRENKERPESEIYFQIFKKLNINEHPVFLSNNDSYHFHVENKAASEKKI